eukprot:6390620-Prymnesium_polylepis.2
MCGVKVVARRTSDGALRVALRSVDVPGCRVPAGHTRTHLTCGGYEAVPDGADGTSMKYGPPRACHARPLACHAAPSTRGDARARAATAHARTHVRTRTTRTRTRDPVRHGGHTTLAPPAPRLRRPHAHGKHRHGERSATAAPPAREASRPSPRLASRVLSPRARWRRAAKRNPSDQNRDRGPHVHTRARVARGRSQHGRPQGQRAVERREGDGARPRDGDRSHPQGLREQGPLAPLA